MSDEKLKDYEDAMTVGGLKGVLNCIEPADDGLKILIHDVDQQTLKILSAEIWVGDTSVPYGMLSYVLNVRKVGNADDTSTE